MKMYDDNVILDPRETYLWDDLHVKKVQDEKKFKKVFENISTIIEELKEMNLFLKELDEQVVEKITELRNLVLFHPNMVDAAAAMNEFYEAKELCKSKVDD